MTGDGESPLKRIALGVVFAVVFVGGMGYAFLSEPFILRAIGLESCAESMEEVQQAALTPEDRATSVICNHQLINPCIQQHVEFGYIQGQLEAAVEPDGSVSEVVFSSDLAGPLQDCLRPRVAGLQIPDYSAGRIAVRCQIMGEMSASSQSLSLDRAVRPLADGQALAQPAGQGAGAQAQAAPQAVENPNATVQWQNVMATPECTFFSGPGALGRDDRYGDSALWINQGQGASLQLTPFATFIGQRQGETVTLQRQSRHESNRWEVTEQIELTAQGATFSGAYRYNECDTQNRPSCPGGCSIQATMTLTPAASPPAG